MYRVLVTSHSFGKDSGEAVKLLESIGCELVYSPKGHLQEEELASIIENVDALIVGIDQVSRRVIESSNRLKVICMHGTGIDHIDLAAASERGIYVGNAPGGNNNAVAELTVGLIITAARHITLADRSIRQAEWQRKVGMEISGKTLGIIGLGHIGKRVVELVAGFGMHCLAYDQYRDVGFADKYDVRYVELSELFQLSDIVSLHIPLSPKTHHLISSEQLSMMKSNAVLVNTSRGAIVDEKALFKALKAEVIAGAAIDAFAHEPLEEGSLLRTLDNIVLTPHIAASTRESANHVDFINAQTIVSVLTGSKAYSVVNEDLIAQARQPKNNKMGGSQRRG